MNDPARGMHPPSSTNTRRRETPASALMNMRNTTQVQVSSRLNSSMYGGSPHNSATPFSYTQGGNSISYPSYAAGGEQWAPNNEVSSTERKSFSLFKKSEPTTRAHAQAWEPIGNTESQTSGQSKRWSLFKRAEKPVEEEVVTSSTYTELHSDGQQDATEESSTTKDQEPSRFSLFYKRREAPGEPESRSGRFSLFSRTEKTPATTSEAYYSYSTDELQESADQSTPNSTRVKERGKLFGSFSKKSSYDADDKLETQNQYNYNHQGGADSISTDKYTYGAYNYDAKTGEEKTERNQEGDYETAVNEAEQNVKKPSRFSRIFRKSDQPQSNEEAEVNVGEDYLIHLNQHYYANQEDTLGENVEEKQEKKWNRFRGIFSKRESLKTSTNEEVNDLSQQYGETPVAEMTEDTKRGSALSSIFSRRKSSVKSTVDEDCTTRAGTDNNGCLPKKTSKLIKGSADAYCYDDPCYGNTDYVRSTEEYVANLDEQAQECESSGRRQSKLGQWLRKRRGKKECVTLSVDNDGNVVSTPYFVEYEYHDDEYDDGTCAGETALAKETKKKSSIFSRSKSTANDDAAAALQDFVQVSEYWTGEEQEQEEEKSPKKTSFSSLFSHKKTEKATPGATLITGEQWTSQAEGGSAVAVHEYYEPEVERQETGPGWTFWSHGEGKAQEIGETTKPEKKHSWHLFSRNGAANANQSAEAAESEANLSSVDSYGPYQQSSAIPKPDIKSSFLYNLAMKPGGGQNDAANIPAEASSRDHMRSKRSIFSRQRHSKPDTIIESELETYQQ